MRTLNSNAWDLSKETKELLKSTKRSKIYSVPSVSGPSCVLKVSTSNLQEGSLHAKSSHLSKHVVKYFTSYTKLNKVYM